MSVPFFQAKLPFDRGFQAFAKFMGAVHGQCRLFAIEENFQVRTFARQECGAL